MARRGASYDKAGQVHDATGKGWNACSGSDEIKIIKS